MENTKKNSVKILKFNEAYVAPSYKWNKSTSVIEWGKKNNYPLYILDLYNNYGSPTHKSIINRKTKMLAGNVLREVQSPELSKFIKDNNVELEIKKASLDFELLNGFAFEIIWDNGGENIVSFNHIPLHKLRLGIPSDEIDFDYLWFTNDWNQFKKAGYEPEFIRAFDPKVKEGKQIFFYSEYNPTTDDLYPIPGYSTSMNWVETDYEISRFHLNQVKQGYAPSFMLNFATGIPTEEEQDDFFKEFKKNFQGSENSGKIIMTYSEGQEQAPELNKIDLNDSDKRFNLLKTQIKDEIIMGHEIPPQLLLSVAGKLGSQQEREELMAEFQMSYVSPRQIQMEDVVNDILIAGGFDENVELLTYLGEITEETIVVDDKQLEAQATLKGSVGGVQALTGIIQNVASGLMSRSSAIATLELIFGFNEEQAIRLLGDVEEGEGLPGDVVPTEEVTETIL